MSALPISVTTTSTGARLLTTTNNLSPAGLVVQPGVVLTNEEVNAALNNMATPSTVIIKSTSPDTGLIAETLPATITDNGGTVQKAISDPGSLITTDFKFNLSNWITANPGLTAIVGFGIAYTLYLIFKRK